jgi:hypothetical protein
MTDAACSLDELAATLMAPLGEVCAEAQRQRRCW